MFVKELLSVYGVAKEMGVSHVTVLRWVDKGWLVPSAYSTNRRLFDPEYIRAKREEREREKKDGKR